jgi:hypothetical protein
VDNLRPGTDYQSARRVHQREISGLTHILLSRTGVAVLAVRTVTPQVKPNQKKYGRLKAVLREAKREVAALYSPPALAEKWFRGAKANMLR